MTIPVFELSDVKYCYQGTPALNGLTLIIPQGKRVVLLGANGSGKSTLLRLLDALYFTETGSFRAFGEALDQQRMDHDEYAYSFRRRVGFVFQNPEVQLFNASVFDELAFGPLQLRWPTERIRQRVEETLIATGLVHLRERPPHRLSGGEKKRVALASVLILEPEVLLLDEPTASLDPESESRLIETLIDWRGSERTLVMATHDLDIVEDVADICVVMQHGQVVAQGTPGEILADQGLLNRTGLVHAHRHGHGHGGAHAHAHLHSRTGLAAKQISPFIAWKPVRPRKPL